MERTEVCWRMLEPFDELFPVEENAGRLVDLLRIVNQTVATAESCTGGLVSAAIVSVPLIGHALELCFIYG